MFNVMVWAVMRLRCGNMGMGSKGKDGENTKKINEMGSESRLRDAGIYI